jgi:hypothetical protein
VREGDPGRLVRPRYVDGDIRRQRTSRGLDQAIFELASRQHGVFGRAQLIALGLSAEAIDHRVRAGRLQVVHVLRLHDRLSLPDLLHRYPGRSGSRKLSQALQKRNAGSTRTRSEIEELLIELSATAAVTAG